MSRKQKFKALAVLFIVLLGLGIAVNYMRNADIPVLEPAGTVGRQEKHLIVEAGLISLVVVIPVFAMAIGFAWKYRATNPKADYRPDWDHNRLLETAWWGIPGLIILVLSVIAWNSAHALDPFRSLSSSNQTLNIQVVSLDWKWLFIYPGQGVASVNYVEFPANTDINFQITSDSVMNSFWIPALGSQIYSMPGMSTEVHLMADRSGSFRGLSANISGVGFAGMDFTAKAVPKVQFSQWVKTAQASPSRLSSAAYKSLASPSQNNAVAYYSHPEPSLFDSIISKYAGPALFSPGGPHG